MSGPAIMDVRQAAAYIGCSRSTLYLMLKDGSAPRCIKYGRQRLRRWRKVDLDEWLEARGEV